MPRLDADFDNTEPAAVGDYTIDFGPNVPTGSSIDNAPWTLSVRYVAPGYTIDSDPASRLVGEPTISGTKTIQRIADLQAGNTYLVVTTGTMENGEVVILWCTLTCVSPI